MKESQINPLESGIFYSICNLSGQRYTINMDNFSEILKKRSLPGMLIFDVEGRFLYSNRETLEMIAGLGESDKAGESTGPPIPTEIHALCRELKDSVKPQASDPLRETPHAILANREGQIFSLRAFFMGDHGGDTGPSHMMVLVERIIKKHEVDLEKARKEFKLSKREAEVLNHLCQGANNKEISDRLYICEYTVKDHIKMLMRKMGVSSRNEILVALK